MTIMVPEEPVSGATAVRLLINDTGTGDAQIFADGDVQAFLTMEGGVKLAAAQALDVIASNEALVSKRIRTLDLQTDGPAVAKALREHATALRAQHQAGLDAESDGTFEITGEVCVPELTEWPVTW